MAGFGDLAALSDLLASGDAAADLLENTTALSTTTPTPGSIGNSNPNGSIITRAVPPVLGSAAHLKQQETAPEKPSGDIWDVDEVEEANAIKLPEKDDDRAVPKHEIYYKQDVDSGDVWLGLSDKDPGSSCCSHLVIKMHFPGHKLADIELDVTKDSISAETSKFRLKTFLPTEVDSDNGNAKFDTSTHILTVTCPVSSTLY